MEHERVMKEVPSAWKTSLRIIILFTHDGTEVIGASNKRLLISNSLRENSVSLIRKKKKNIFYHFHLLL